MKSKLAVLFFLLLACVPVLAQHKEDSAKDKPRVEYRDVDALAFPGLTITQQSVVDYACQTNPGNPPVGKIRVYCDSGTGLLTCLSSTGTNVCPSGGGGGGSAVGPAGTVQGSNGSGTFTQLGELDNGSSFNVSRNISGSGPNPSFDITRYGGYEYTGAQPTTTGTMGSASSTLTLGAALDFVNGQGILVLGAGPATSLSTPQVPFSTGVSLTRSSNVVTATLLTTAGYATGQSITVTAASDSSFNGTFALTSFSLGTATWAQTAANATATGANITNGIAVSQQNVVGSTSYSYCVVAEDYANGRTACSAVGTTTTGTTNLGAFTAATLTGCARANGIVTCNTVSPHHLSALSFIELSGTGNFFYNGTATLLTASGTTFTYPQLNQNDDAVGITTGTVKALAVNVVQWNEADYTVLRSYIYRCTTTCALPGNAANFALAGVTQGMDGGFLDYGYTITAAQIGNGDVPATAPTAATAQWLPTTITAGSGTTSLTLANTSTTAVSGVTVLHDNTPIFAKVCAAMGTAVTYGGTIYIPNGTGLTAGAAIFPINSTLNFNTQGCSSAGFLEIDIAATISANASVIPRTLSKIKGIASFGHAPNFYGVGIDTFWTGNAYPFIYVLPGTSSNWSMDSFDMQAFRSYQSCVVQDQDGGAGNVTSIRYHDVHTVSSNAPSYILGGGFGFFWEYGGWSTGGTASFATAPAVWLKANYGLGRSVNSQLPGIFSTVHTYMFGGMLWDAAGQSPLTSVGLSATFTDMLAESSYGPMMRLRSGFNPFGGVFTAFSYSDFLGGGATPLIDAVNGSIQGLQLINPGCGTGTQPMFQAQTNVSLSTNIQITTSEGGGCSIVGLPVYVINGNQFVNAQVSTNGPLGDVFYQMPTPGAPLSAVVSSGGSAPVGVLTYFVSAIDVNGSQTLVGPGLSATTTGGNQTVTVTPPTLPNGAVGWIPYRAGGGGAVQVPCSAIAGNAAFVDTNPSACGQSVPGQTTAGLATLSSHGLSGYQVVLTNQFGLTVVPTTLTANRTQTLQDVTDTFVYRTTADTLTNKILTSPVLNGTMSGTGLQGTDTKVLSSGTVSGTGSALCTDVNGGATTSGCPSSASFYQTIQVAGSSKTQEPKLNFIAGTNMTVSCVDNGGATSTDCTLTASNTGATAFSALTAATNSNAGTFAATGNTWDFTGATALKSPVGAGFAPTVSGSFGYDSTANKWVFGQNGATVSHGLASSACSAHQFVNTPATGTTAATCAQPAFTDISGTITTAQEPSSTVNAVTNDTNVTGSIAGQTLTLGWTGTLAKARTLSATVYTDQANTFSTGAQDFSSATSLKVPVGAGLAPTASGLVGYDSTANKLVFGQNGSTISYGLASSSACAAHSWVSTPATAAAIAVCTQPAYTDISGSLSASQVTNAFDRSTNNALGSHYFDMTTIAAPANPAASNGRIYIDSSTNQLSCILSTGASCAPSGGGGGGANQALSNLASVAINTSLLPSADNTIDLGSASFRWRNIYFGGSLISSTAGAVTIQGNTGTCTGAAGLGTLCFNSTGNRPTYDFNTTGFANLVLSGVDINTSDQVTVTHLASPLPVAQGGVAVTDFSFSGSTHKACTTSGTLTNGDVVKFDASGNCIDGTAIAANLNTNTSNFTAGDVISAAGAHSTQDSGIAAANVFTTTTKVNVLEASSFCSDAGSTDDYACNLTQAITSYVTGTHYRFSANTANTTVATLNLNALGAKTIKKAVGGITTDLATNDIRVGQWVDVVYDGTNFQMQSLLGNSPGSGTVTTTGSPANGNLSQFSGGSSITNGDLSGDATTSGTLAVTVVKINGTAFSGTNGDVVKFGAANTPADAGFLASNVTRLDTTNTGGASMTLDMSASTSLRIPNAAGASTTTSGAFIFDTTNKGIHAGANSVSNTLGLFPDTLVPTDGDCVVWKKSSSVITLDDRGACPAGGSGTVNSGTAGNLAYYATSTNAVSDASIVAANVMTNSTNLVNGDLVNATGNHTANDSGIVTANVVTAASNFVNGNLIQGAGANKTSSDSGIATANVVTASSNAAAANQIWQSGGASKAAVASDLAEKRTIPFADCVNGSAGSALSYASSTWTATCRAGSNNLGAALQCIPSTGCAAQFSLELPLDWDTGAQPYINIFYASGANTSGTVIWTVSSGCSKEDGSVTDDPAFNAESAFGSQTMAVANRMWAKNGQFTAITSGNNCIAGSWINLKVALSGTASSAINAYQAIVTIPTRPVIQAN